MRYYFDIQDGTQVSRDDIGIDCRSDYAARVEATRALTDMAAEYLPTNGRHRDLAIHVRSQIEAMFTVKLKYDVVSDDDVSEA